jgi:hypothetical protein
MKKSEALTPEKSTASKVHGVAPKQGKKSISMREIDREIRTYRRETKIISEVGPARRG